MAPSPLLGVCFPREFPPSLVIEFAERLESGGAEAVGHRRLCADGIVLAELTGPLAVRQALAAAGATSVAFFPPPFVDEARHQIDRLLVDVVAARA